jgi:two-component system response regulator HydG
MKRILVIDDDAGIVESMRNILELEGYEVDTAMTARDGLQMIQESFYHLGLFDIKLPDMDGTDLLIEAQKIRPGMRKIMVTGFASLDNSVKSLNEGADAFILKPVDPEKLLEVVKEKLDEQERESELDGGKVAEYLEEQLLGLKR